jgi:hypothetical protein
MDHHVPTVVQSPFIHHPVKAIILDIILSLGIVYVMYLMGDFTLELWKLIISLCWMEVKKVDETVTLGFCLIEMFLALLHLGVLPNRTLDFISCREINATEVLLCIVVEN